MIAVYDLEPRRSGTSDRDADRAIALVDRTIDEAHETGTVTHAESRWGRDGALYLYLTVDGATVVVAHR